MTDGHAQPGVLDGAATAALLLDAGDAASLLGIGKSTFWRMVSAGQMIRPVRMGNRSKWRAEEVRDWIRAGCPAPIRWNWPTGA